MVGTRLEKPLEPLYEMFKTWSPQSECNSDLYAEKCPKKTQVPSLVDIWTTDEPSSIVQKRQYSSNLLVSSSLCVFLKYLEFLVHPVGRFNMHRFFWIWSLSAKISKRQYRGTFLCCSEQMFLWFHPRLLLSQTFFCSRTDVPGIWSLAVFMAVPTALKGGYGVSGGDKWANLYTKYQGCRPQ